MAIDIGKFGTAVVSLFRGRECLGVETYLDIPGRERSNAGIAEAHGYGPDVVAVTEARFGPGRRDSLRAQRYARDLRELYGVR